MSLRTQAKVLRVLDEQRFEPLGSADAVQTDVRVIASTNKILEAEIEPATFARTVLPFERNPVACRRSGARRGHRDAADISCVNSRPRTAVSTRNDVRGHRGAAATPGRAT